MAEIRIATWNLHQGMDKRAANEAETWSYLQDKLQPTVALLQEVDLDVDGKPAIPATPGGHVSSPAQDARYATAVVGYGARVAALPKVTTRYWKRHVFDISPRVPATFAAARVLDLPGADPFVAISMYGRMAPLYAQTGVLRAIADLIPLFDTPDFGHRVILGGDLNVYDQTSDKVMRGRWEAILALLESLGLVNLLKKTAAQRTPPADCPCRKADCWHVETFRHRNRPAGEPGYFTTDYLFASPSLAERMVGTLEVWNDRPEVWALSDHCPLVARFEM